jgi:hypothetical protein
VSIIMTDQSDHQIIANLVEGMEVLQVGFHQGFDTADLARAAVRVVAIGAQPGVVLPGWSNPIQGWWAIQRFYGVDGSVLRVEGDAGEVVRIFVPHQFDVAVLDPSAFELRLPYGLIERLATVAGKVIILDATGWDTAGICAALNPDRYQVEQSGHLRIIEQIAAGEDAERKVEE